MCGICGYMQKDDISDSNTIIAMKNSILHRGKSENDIYINKNVALGHARLSIIDLAGGKQPMTRKIKNNSYTIVYNGELYNTQLLRNILTTRGYSFETDSDTEVLLTLYIEFKEKMLDFINGIFAFSIYDENENSLFLARDRLGIKPLFFAKTDDTFLFSSEIKGILASSKIPAIVTKEELIELFALGPAHTPTKTYFKDIYDLEAGHYLLYQNGELKNIKYWDLQEKKLYDSDEEIISNVRELVTDATKRQLVSDVGIGSMLSGGLDSSIVTQIAANSITSINTYSINYEGNDDDFTPNDYQLTKDSDFVKIMVHNLNSNHKEITVRQKDLFNRLYESVIARDTPGMADIDSSMLIFCEEIAKNNQKVVLSGECSDEIFGGYPWFYKEHLRKTTGFPWALSENLRASLVKEEIFNSQDITNYITKVKLNTLNNVHHVSLDTFENEFKEINYLTIKYFMNTLVERTDRMSMRNSLEVRVPFADHRIFEYVYNVDAKLKLGIRNSNMPTEKYILKQAFKDYIPDSIIQRKKSPFPKTYSLEYLELLEAKLNEIIDNPTSKINEIINIDYVKYLISTHGKDLKENLFGQLMTYPQTLAFIIQIEFWLTAYNIKIEL